jgi:LysR family hydrogen peroxide-inducible transcriptional activator
MELHQLEYLVALAEEGSFTRAAERLAIAQPSLSQQIQKLEREIGQPLFDRLPRGVTATEAGQNLLIHARRILAQIEDAKRQAGEQRGAVSGALTIGAIPTIAPYLLPEVMKAFAADHPDVRLELVEDVTARLLEQLDHGRLDFAVMSDADPGRSLILEEIGREPLLLLLPEKHRLAKRRAIAWADIHDDHFLILHEMHCLTGQVMLFCRPQGLKPTIAARGAQLSTLAEMISAGLGVSVVPTMMKSHDAGAGRVYRPFASDPPDRAICVAWSLFRYRTNAARAFVKVLKERMSLHRSK